MIGIGATRRKAKDVADAAQTADTKKAAMGSLFVGLLADRTGLEPATPGGTGRYSNQLNYRS